MHNKAAHCSLLRLIERRFLMAGAMARDQDNVFYS